MSYVNLAMGASKFMTMRSQGRQDQVDAQAKGMALDYQADQEEQASQQQAAIIRRASLYATARETAAYAASGVAVDSGSAAEVVNQTRTDATHDAYMAMLNGTKRADQLRANAKIVEAGGKVAQDNALASGVAAAGSSFASGWKTGGGY